MDASGCVHCGLCLPTCPTYQVTGVEAESPRGRVLLLQELAQGKDLGPQAAAYLDDCLDCRACEAVCPSHVETGHLVGGWREARGGAATPALRAARRAMRLFLGSPRGLAWLQRLARGAAGGGLGIRRLVPLVAPPGVLRLAKGLPAPMPRSLSRGGVRRPGSPGGVRVAFFAGCVMDAVYAETNLRTADLLALAGAQVEALQGATCCGALAEHAADLATARALARRNIEAFERSGAEWLVVNAAGCSAFLREYGRLFAAEPSWRERAERVAARTVDALVFLAGRSLPELPARQDEIPDGEPLYVISAVGGRSLTAAKALVTAGYRAVSVAGGTNGWMERGWPVVTGVQPS